MVNVLLVFDTRAKKLFDGVDKPLERDSKLQIFRLDFRAAVRHHAANPRELVTSGVRRGNIGGCEGLSQGD